MSTARMLRGLVLVLPLAFTFALGACGSDDEDDGGGNAGTAGSSSTSIDPRCNTSDCPSEPEAYDTEDTCNALIASPCFDEFEPYRDCLLDNEECDANGRSVASSTQVCNDLSAIVVMCGTM